ncbi:DUF7560 family zinc ribbon protein [Natronosalvus rutilus]|uniref:Zinc ribbon domain-containing protein n=1 Tax=Natronosalvus rutilus TaxID=2953753 RepID=A0A9E7STW8_9EURY|nr:zinc ribbon domain-containing protein [Natronosalvus rutilus]UTF52197.1 zinc ribbon domain-containing protein [Natronosalvus rutilus]
MTTYEFTCPGCGQRGPVDGDVRNATVEYGCPVCGTEVSREHFLVH